MRKKCYEAPGMEIIHVELEHGFMRASIFEKEDEHEKGVTIEEHGFADPKQSWEGDYSDSEWD